MTPRLVAVLIGLAALFAGCGGGVQSLSFPTPPPTSAAVGVTTTTVAPDLTGVSLAPVAGQITTTTVGIGPGAATINGTVLGPQGPVSGASVEADRLVGDAEATVSTTTAADGSFTFAGVLGGRYRVRAWQTPTLAMISPQIFFLGGSETHTLTLTVTAFVGSQITAAIAPDPPTVGDPANLAVQVVTP
ncbi:MAG: carboxypeptidase-like regulatory domain-containing protein, partial [Acidimicrobiales bacterium]